MSEARTIGAALEALFEKGVRYSTVIDLGCADGSFFLRYFCSGLFAGAGVRGGQVIGASDKHGGEPTDRPIRAQDIAATVYRAFGIDPAMGLTDTQGVRVPLTAGRPIAELFG